MGVAYRTRVRPIVSVVGWRDAIGDSCAWGVVWWLLTYCTVAWVALVWWGSSDRTVFVGPSSYVLHRGGMGGAQLAFRLCSKTVRTIGFGGLKNTYGNHPLHAVLA
uniref:Uncharacterized protein n=1 Tax=Siphoviridae sp. ctUWs1 TaxID=2826352 RepID=A0A8S5QTL0_9CAUD|nr:MAG TPA: hypothetical protein [Siphoviridae sp. ctUWs1]